MKRILSSLAIVCFTFFFSTETSAQITSKEWNQNVVGWNLGNQFECVPGSFDNESFQLLNAEGADQAESAWDNPVVTKKTIKAIKAAGFNAIRIPIRWQCHITNDKAMTVSKNWMARVKEVVNWCLDNDLKVIINVHHDKWLEGRPTYKYKDENCQKLALLWMNIATEFKDFDYRLAFAGTNEVHIKDNWGKPTAENLEVQNAYNQTFVDMVRATGGNNEKRHLLVQTYVCNPDFGVENGDFIVPTDETNGGNNYMSVEFHFYNPYDYAGSCKYNFWGKPYMQYGDTPTQDDEKALTDYFDKVDRVWGSQGLGICIGEWGVTDHYSASNIDKAHENATYYCKTFVSEARKRGFSTFVWDNGRFGNGPENFGIFDRKASMKVKNDWCLKGIQEGMK